MSKLKRILSNRVVDFNSKAIQSLYEVKRRNEELGIYSNYIVSNYTNGHIQLRSFEQTFERIEKARGISYKGIHQIRHHFASELMRYGVNIKIISDILRHENMNFTYNRYIHTINEQKINAVQLLDNI